MATSALDVQQSIKQLNDARKLVLGDANYYPQIIQGILPIIGPTARVELRRWGADFFAETFATPAVPAQQKETLCLIVMETLKTMIENPNEDAAVVKSIVQVAASIYPLVLRWTYVSPPPNLHIHMTLNSCKYLPPIPSYLHERCPRLLGWTDSNTVHGTVSTMPTTRILGSV